ncbi:acyltransferase [Collinsella sp. An2]|uniref:acyltransferase family protein n=1 Tax=Collinsella sp. An2 TaxID=1965585 RepID=UPI001302B987|nr:acyltransferase [Collinsella sp. An2]
MGAQANSRVQWVDAMKLFACVLVVLGHLYMSFMAAGWISESSIYYCLPIQTVYTFHVPLFFVCSGFLYQRKRTEYGIQAQVTSIKEKAVSLGVPYVVFTSITLGLKTLFSDVVNSQATPFLQTLFFEPIAPYWYLYTLFLLFCVIPRQRTQTSLVRLFAICFIFKTVYVFVPLSWSVPDAVGKVLTNAVWFAWGMLLSDQSVRERFLKIRAAIIVIALAIVLSMLVYSKPDTSKVTQFFIASLYVYALTSVFVLLTGPGVGKWAASLSKYFLPVYVLHTIAAAGIRSVAIRLGIVGLPAHIILGVLASFIIPVVVYEIACRRWWLLFWFEPKNALRLRDMEKTHV